jgi:hypothetical protein
LAPPSLPLFPAVKKEITYSPEDWEFECYAPDINSASFAQQVNQQSNQGAASTMR